MGIISRLRDTFSNYQFVNKDEYDRVTQDHYEIMKEMNQTFLQSNSRSSIPQPYMDTPEGSKVPIWRVSPSMQYELADYVGDLRAIYETIQREMFRNGIEVRARYKYKCLSCLKEFKGKPSKTYIPMSPLSEIGGVKRPKQQVKDTKPTDNLECDICGNTNPRKWKIPDPKHRIILQTLIDKKVNNNRQNLKIIAREVERDLDIIDAGYALISRKWKIVDLPKPDPITGATKRALKDVVNSEIDEIIRISPTQVSIVASNSGILGVGSDNIPRYICPDYAHRDHTLRMPVCDICGCECFNAFLETNAVPYGVVNAGNYIKMMYSKDEIIWIAGKYYPDILYGNSPLQSIWKKVLSLMYQDEYIWKYFDKDRPPKSLLVMGSRNPEAVTAFMERQRQGARIDPYMPRPIMLNTENVKQGVQFIDLTPNLKELELNDLRRELRQIISAVYGIQPLFYGEQAKAGLGNESLQVTITNRTIKWFQRFFNEQFFAQITDLFEIDDWVIALVDSEEIDQLREEQVRGQKIDNAVKMYGMGFDVETDGNDELQISQHPNPERQMMMMSGMGGIGGNPQDPNKSKSSSPKKEGQTKFDGQPGNQRPSDPGGRGVGDISGSGTGTTLSNKMEKYQENTLQYAMENAKKVENAKNLSTIKEELEDAKKVSKTGDELKNVTKKGYTIEKTIRDHTWEYWDEKLKDEYPDKETRSKVIGSMEAEVKKDKRGI